MAKAIKTPKQPKEPVRVRYKTLSDGSPSISTSTVTEKGSMSS